MIKEKHQMLKMKLLLESEKSRCALSVRHFPVGRGCMLVPGCPDPK